MIYLDSAATTLQKPASVFRAVEQAGRSLASPGRGSYAAAAQAGKLVFRCRERAAVLFGGVDAEHVIMTSSATHGLNLAIRSLVKPGSRVVISGYEHNAVTRTLHAIPEVTVQVADCSLFDRAGAVEAFEQLLPGADAAVCTHVSNVFGFVLPVEEIAALCRRYSVPLIVDAAQSAGMLPVDVEGWGAAYVAMPGHKGLYGPQGTGLLICGREASPEPLLYGGTGSLSRLQTMPDFLPDRLEAGTINVCGIAGLLEGLRFVERQGVKAIGRHESALARETACALRCLAGDRIEVFAGEGQSGVLSFRPKEGSCEDMAEALARKGFALRAGCHCAPLAHQTVGTLETGTVRASFSAFSHPREGRLLAEAVAGLTKN